MRGFLQKANYIHLSKKNIYALHRAYTSLRISRPLKLAARSRSSLKFFKQWPISMYCMVQYSFTDAASASSVPKELSDPAMLEFITKKRLLLNEFLLSLCDVCIALIYIFRTDPLGWRLLWHTRDGEHERTSAVWRHSPYLRQRNIQCSQGQWSGEHSIL